MNSVVHIVPQLPPAVDGVGDYCRNLWRHWPEPLPEWKFLVTRGAQASASAWPEVDVREFERTGRGLAAALERTRCTTAVLHYVGYGFQPKGIPAWLPRAIREWRRNHPGRRLVTMFHEMYARSSPLRSPFWVAPIARRIIRQLVEISDSWVTSCERYFNQLTTEFGAAQDLGRTIPIGSNIARVRAPVVRHGASADGFRFVVFGLARTRLWALQRHGRMLRALQDAGALHSITLLGKPNGPGDEPAWQKIRRRIGADARCNLRYNLSEEEISRELLGHDFGLLANEPDTLTKSGVFAAYAAHGIIPIVSHRAQAVLAPSLSDVVIANDESGDNSNLRLMLAEPARLEAAREKLLAFAARELSWSRVTAAWSSLLAANDPGRFVTLAREQARRTQTTTSQSLVTQP